MKGLSITAIGLRSFAECWGIYQTLEPALQLDYLELAIGSQCDVDYDYGDLPLVLHDSCLYEGFLRRKLHPLKPRTWQAYADFAASHNVLAVSLHPPLKRHCTQLELYDAIAQMQQTLQVPVYSEVMPDQEYWCSSISTLIDVPLLLDVSHVNIWHQGNVTAVEDTCLTLLDRYNVAAIHLSHNAGKADTHDLIPSNVWFGQYLEQWNRHYLVTYESLPVQYQRYQRLDKLIRITIS